MMTLGMIEYWSEEGFKHLHDLGLHAVEFCYNDGNNPDDLIALIPDIKKWSEQYDVKVLSIGRWGADKIADDGTIIEEELQNTYKLIDVCAELGCPVFNTGVNEVEGKSFFDNCDYAVEFLSKACAYAKEKGVKVACYNCDWSNFVREPKAWLAIMSRVRDLGIKYDPSHCINSGSGKYLEEINDWADRIYHFHIKGTININGDHVDDPPAGLDMIDWRQIMGLLYEYKYDGMLSIEPHSGTWQGELGEWGIKLTIDYISKMVYTG